MRLQTSRFILRSFEEKDCEPVTNYLSDWAVIGPLVMPPYPFHHKHALDFFKKMRAAEVAGRQEAFVIADPQTDDFLGVVGIHPEPSEKSNEKVCKLGYWLGAPYWRQGIMQEVLPPILKLAFADLGYDRMVAFTNTDNERSINVLRTAGFTYLGLIPSPPEETRGTPQSTSWELMPAMLDLRKAV
ncbi:MAG TPA: hypothetical protein DCY07_03175 [Rhodospirillaceae bacterium]|nr:hypothetical protein [Rhodospirillaceae bacterium]